MHYLDYNEKRRHGTELFPMAYYFIDKNHPQYIMPFHWHKETEIIWVTSGQLHISLNEKHYTLQSRQALIIPAGTIHGGEPDDCVYECLVFDPDAFFMYIPAVRELFRQADNAKLVINELYDFHHPKLLEEVRTLFYAARSQAPGWELTTTGKLFNIYGYIFENNCWSISDTENPRSDKMLHLKPVLEYIEAHYDNPLTLEELSRLAGMSPKYFCRFFNAITHRTPIDYLNYYRIERACLLLETDDSNGTEIAFKCGFNDSSYFARIFKKYKHMTPRQYKNRMRVNHRLSDGA